MKFSFAVFVGILPNLPTWYLSRLSLEPTELSHCFPSKILESIELVAGGRSQSDPRSNSEGPHMNGSESGFKRCERLKFLHVSTLLLTAAQDAIGISASLSV